MQDCIFCKIIKGEIPSTCIYEDEDVFAFRDINPAAPTHVLLVPKRHIDGADTLSDDDPEHAALIVKLIFTAGKLARELGLQDGWRLVTNVGEHGGQTVRHLHIHLLGGAALGDFGAKLEFRK
ncbi:MAG: histidine triad nucleotide-binding protein [Oscillospiraceae bacterium]|nr:histidine triad nucleotide-binding protein [Oscillospiraceae bacterium]